MRLQISALELRGKGQSYGIISMFDGTSTTYTSITREVGYAPSYCIAAEYDQDIRYIAADKHGFPIDEKDPVWRPNKYGVPSRYLKDVWEICADFGQVLKDIRRLFPTCKRLIIVAGSPCQDLTFMSLWKGLLGILGQRSKHFQVLPVLLMTMQILLPEVQIFLIVENAGSMRPYHLACMLDLLGWPQAIVK